MCSLVPSIHTRYSTPLGHAASHARLDESIRPYHRAQRLNQSRGNDRHLRFRLGCHACIRKANSHHLQARHLASSIHRVLCPLPPAVRLPFAASAFPNFSSFIRLERGTCPIVSHERRKKHAPACFLRRSRQWSLIVLVLHLHLSAPPHSLQVPCTDPNRSSHHGGSSWAPDRAMWRLPSSKRWPNP
jgi:hypothetical protein